MFMVCSCLEPAPLREPAAAFLARIVDECVVVDLEVDLEQDVSTLGSTPCMHSGLEPGVRAPSQRPWRWVPLHWKPCLLLFLQTVHILGPALQFTKQLDAAASAASGGKAQDIKLQEVPFQSWLEVLSTFARTSNTTYNGLVMEGLLVEPAVLVGEAHSCVAVAPAMVTSSGMTWTRPPILRPFSQHCMGSGC